MAFKGMRFCRECDNMLQPKEQIYDETKAQLVYDCRICGYFELAKQGDETDNCVYKSEQRVEDKFFVDRECIKDPALQRRIGHPCVKCKNTVAVTFTNPTKDRMNLIFVCTNCTYYWKKDELDENDDLEESEKSEEKQSESESE